MPRLSRALPALLAVAALAVAGCGGDEETRGLSKVKSDRLLALLEDAEQQFEGGECTDLQTTLDDLATEVNEVDEAEVEESVRNGLQTESQALIDLASQDCEEATEPTIPTETVIPTETITETTEPTTTEETEPTTTEEIDEPPGQGPDGEGPPGQEEDSESGFKPPKPPKEPKEEAAVDEQSSENRT